MARKDVDLVIRARDEAAKVVDSITAAINEFVEAQGDLGKAAGKTSSTLGQLGTALGTLDKELRGLSVSDKIGQEFDKAAAAAQRLNAEFEETQQSARELARDLQKAEYATERLTSKASGAAAAQAKQSAALEKARAAQAELTAALAKANAERDKLVRQDERLVASLSKQEAKVAEVTARYDRLAQEVAATANPTKTLQNRLESANTSLQKQTQRLDELRTKYAATQGGIAQTGTSIANLAGKLEQANAAVARQETVVAKINTNYRELQAAAKSASRNQKDIADATDKTADALARQSQRIERAQTELQQLGAAAGKADAALAELAGQSGAALQKSFDQQRRAMLEAKREYTELTQASTRLAGEIGRVGVPTREMAEAFIRNRSEAARAKQEYLAQRDSLHQLSGVLKQTGTDLDSLRGKQNQFAQIQAQTGAAIARIRQTAQQSAGSYNLLSSNANRAAQSIRQTATAATAASSGMASAASKTNSLSEAYRRLYGESRQAMSWTQRLRGEVLSLISAYGGIYGVISLLQRTIDAYQTLEAATSRLNVAFSGDNARVGQELDFIRRNADRLGVEFGSLATEYSKFAIATQGTSLEGEKTRKIFISVAEAARVNKSSFDELRGVFTALTQIVSKGAVQMEELRQQLGDRLPGALQLMADGLGVSTAELIKMMEQGEVTADALVPFAEELDKRFGPGLAEALKSTTTSLGQFKNAAFQALVQFGQAGFIESFNGLLKDLTETLRSADFQSFAAKASQAFGLLIDVIGLAIRNFDLLVIAASAFAGIKLGPIVVALIGQLATLRTSLVTTAAGFTTARTAMVSSAAGVGVATVAFRGLTLAIRALLSSTGIGLAITAISVAIGYWATRADAATEAMNAHQKMVDQVKNAYDRAAGSAKKWADEVKALSVTQAQQNLTQLRTALEDVRSEARPIADAFGLDTRGTVNAVNAAVSAFKAGTLSAADFKKEIDRIAQADPDLNRDLALSFLDIADRAAEAEKKVGEANDVLIAITGTAEEQAAALKRLNGDFEDTGASAAQAASKAEEFKSALEKINEVVPEIGKNLDIMKQKAQLDEAFQSAARAATTMGQLNQAVNEYNESLGRLYQNQADRQFGNFTSGMDASAALLRDRESFRPTPYWDVNAYRIGFGSDTVTLADGSIQKVVQGMRISVEDANRDLYRRIGEFQDVVKGQIGADRFNQFSPQGQAALTSIAYNYGSLPERILNAVRTGTNEEIAAAIRGLGGDNGGINRERRNIEASLFTTQANVEPLAAKEREEAEKRAQEEERAAEARSKFHEEQKASIEAAQFELSIQDQELVKREQAKAIREAEIAAQKAGTELTQQEREAILANVEAKFRQQQIEEQTNATKERATEAEERVNQLLQQRQALQEQLAIYQQSGDTEKVAETEASLQRVNTELQAAIANAQAMWQAVGGGAADTAIAKLQTASLEASRFKAQAQQNYIDWTRVGNLFASGLTNAFDQFAQAVANGEDVGEAARDAFLKFAADFLRQIAQMIIQQMILNALRSFSPGLFGGVGVGVGHTGGLVGSSRVGAGNGSRSVNPAIFAGAMRYHEGGIAGLRPGEVPLIAKQGEEILTEDDPRHMLNGGGAASGQPTPQDIKVVNAIDSGSFIDAGLNSKVGERAILNFIRANSGAVKSALG